MQGGVGLHHGEGVAEGLADHHQSVHQLLRSLVEGWRIFAPVHLEDYMYEDKMQNCVFNLSTKTFGLTTERTYSADFNILSFWAASAPRPDWKSESDLKKKISLIEVDLKEICRNLKENSRSLLFVCSALRGQRRGKQS